MENEELNIDTITTEEEQPVKKRKRGRPKKIKKQEVKQDEVVEEKIKTEPAIKENIKTPDIDLSFKPIQKRLSLTKTQNYNNILNNIVDNFGNWDITGRGTYYLENKGHSIEYDGYSLPIIDDEYLLSDILTEKMPEELVEWLENIW